MLAEVDDRVGAEHARRASGRTRGSGGRARAAGRGRSRPGSRRSRAAAGWRRRRCRGPGPRTRSRRRRRTTRPAAGPTSRRSGRAARPAASSNQRDVVGDRQPRRRAAQLGVGEELLVVAAGGDQRVDERVAVGEVVLDVVAGVAQRVAAAPSRDAGVSSPTALPTRACLVGKDESTIAVRCSRAIERPQPRVADREPRQPGAALGVRRVVQRLEREPVQRLLERDRHADDAPVELGDRDLHRGVERRQPAVGLRPALRARSSRRAPG